MIDNEIKELLDKEQLTSEEVKRFVALIRDMSDSDIEAMDADGAVTKFYEKLQNNPWFANFNKREELLKTVAGGIDVFKTISDIAVARKQVEQANADAEALQSPSSPPITPKSAELQTATENARRDITRRLPELDPVMQRNLDLLQKGLNVAETASTGQASVYGSLAQGAINRATRANQDMIPAAAAIRRKQKEEYRNLVKAGINEDDMRFKQAMRKYAFDERRYLQESEAIGMAGRQGNENLAGLKNDLYGSLSQLGLNMAKQGNMFSSRDKSPLKEYGQPQIGGINLPESGIMNMTGGGLFHGGVNRPMIEKYTAISGLDPKFGKFSNKLNYNLENAWRPSSFNPLPYHNNLR